MRKITIRHFFQEDGESIAQVVVSGLLQPQWPPNGIWHIRCEELIQLGQMCKDHEMGLAHDLTEEEKRVEMERMKRAEEEEDEEEYRQSLDEPDFEFEDSFYGEQK